MATDFEIYMAANMPKRNALETYESVSYDGNPNDASAPAALKGAPKGTWFLQQTGDVYWRKRTSASDSWVIANLDATFEEMDLYIRATDVSADDNNPGTIALPLETLAGAKAKLPRVINHAIRIHLGPHAGNGYSTVAFNGYILNANIYIIGDGGGGVTDGFTEILGPTSAGAGSSNVVIKSSGLSDTEYNGYGEYWGATLEILDGAAAGNRRGIRNNTTTDIVPNVFLSGTVNEGDQYRIVKPAIKIYESNSGFVPLVNNMGDDVLDFRYPHTNRVHFINLRFDSIHSGEYFFLVNNAAITFIGCYCSKTVYFRGDGYIATGDELDAAVIDLPGISSVLQWTGWGFVVDSSSGYDGVFALDRTNIRGTFNTPTYNSGGASALINNGSFWGLRAKGTIRMISKSKTVITCYPFVSTLIGASSNATALYVEDADTTLELVAYGGSIEVIEVFSDGDAIVCDERAHTVLIANSSSSMIINSASGFGLKVKYLSSIENAGLALPTVNASAGDFTVNNGASAHSISELTVGSSFSNINHGSIYRED